MQRKTLSNFILALSLTCLALPALAQLSEVDQSGLKVQPDLFARDSLRIDSIVCPFKNEVDYEPGDIECGLLEVPENREKADSRFIELHFVKINAKVDEANDAEVKWTQPKAGKRDDPVIYLTGGPGAKVTTYVKRFKDHGLIKHRDLYILEQRGIGYSDDFCPFYSTRQLSIKSPKTYAEKLAQKNDAIRQCFHNAARAGVDLSGYNTIENARDVQALRMALGFESWNVWGLSYGTILGQAYLKQDPQGIKAVALDSVMPLFARDDALYWRMAKWYDRDLKKLDEACQQDENCAEYYPDLGAQVRAVAQSVTNSPISVAVKDVEHYPDGQARLFEYEAAGLPFMLLYEDSNFPALPAIIHGWSEKIRQRDESFFKLIVQAPSNFFTFSRGMHDAVLCLDGGRDSQRASGLADLRDFEVLAPVYGSEASYQAISDICREMQVAPRDAAEYAMTETSIPSLIIAGDMDPVTPPPLAREILPGFKNGTYVEFPYAGHGPTRSVECAGDMLNLFYDSPQRQPDLSCVEQVKAPEFIAPLMTTDLFAQLSLIATEDKNKLAKPIVWVGVSVLLLVIGLFVHSINWFINRTSEKNPVYVASARPLSWLASVTAVVGLAVFAAAAAATINVTETLILFGLVPWARYGLILVYMAGVMGLVVIYQIIQVRMKAGIAAHLLLGYSANGLAAVCLSLFFISWGVSPF